MRPGNRDAISYPSRCLLELMTKAIVPLLPALGLNELVLAFGEHGLRKVTVIVRCLVHGLATGYEPGYGTRPWTPLDVAVALTRGTRCLASCARSALPIFRSLWYQALRCGSQQRTRDRHPEPGREAASVPVAGKGPGPSEHGG
jgi:hypothetical protein